MKLEGVGGRSQAPSFPCRILVLTQTLSTQKLLRGHLTATTDVSLSSSKVTALPSTGQKASVWLGCVWRPSPPLVQEPALPATRESRGLSGSAKYFLLGAAVLVGLGTSLVPRCLLGCWPSQSTGDFCGSQPGDPGEAAREQAAAHPGELPS